MQTLRVLRALGPIDARSVQRDPLLRWTIVLPLLLALAARWFFPLMVARLGALFGADMLPYYPPMMGVALLLLPPLLVGMVVGFLLLDQRDDQTLVALQVTPLPLAGYLAYRIAVPLLLSMLVSAAVLPLAGMARMGPLPLLAVALTAAPLAPIAALFLASFAGNKVQGFALTKVSGILLIPPLAAYFVESGWQHAFGLLPTYWPARLYWGAQAGESDLWFYLGAGLLYQGVLLALLLRRFERVVHG